MLLKCSNSDRKVLISCKGGGTSSTSNITRGTGMRMTMSTSSTMTPRIHRKGIRIPSKRHPGKAMPGKLHSISRVGPGKKIINRPHPPPCDNSNDSGFGFDQHVEHHHNSHHSQQIMRPSTQRSGSYENVLNTSDGSEDLIGITSGSLLSSSSSLSSSLSSSSSNSSSTSPTSMSSLSPTLSLSSSSISSTSSSSSADNNFNTKLIQNRTKRRKIGTITAATTPIQINIDDNEDACSDDAFIQKITSSGYTHGSMVATTTTVAAKYYTSTGPRTVMRPGKRPAQMQQNTYTTSKDGLVQLEIVSQPEQQHRARYQTEGSRGAVKDRSGNGFPIVKLIGYNKPASLQVFIGTDVGRIAPHMFYQACKVAGKNSTPCNEKKVDGTMIIEIDFKQENDFTINCDCVGILKERNVDVEHRFPDQSAQRNKKKSTRCRMVFRTIITADDGKNETLQVCSQPIICTQPPGVPEICKKSLTSCPVEGGLELFIIGKNFLKDTLVIFKDDDNDMPQLPTIWEQRIAPDKEYLQQTHLVCVVPPYFDQNLIEPVTVQILVMSSGKQSESHDFVYLPKGRHNMLSSSTTLGTIHGSITNCQDTHFADNNTGIGNPASNSITWPTKCLTSPMGNSLIETKNEEIDSGMMPPPATTQVPIGVRRPSVNSLITEQQINQITNCANVTNNCLKTEIIDESTQNSMSCGDLCSTDATIVEHFPVSVHNESSLDGTNSLKDLTPFSRSIRKQSLHLLDIQSSMVNENSRLSGFSNSTATSPQNEQTMNPLSAAVVELVKQEKINEFENRMYNATRTSPQSLNVTSVQNVAAVAAAVVEQQQQQQNHQQQQNRQDAVNRFLSNISLKAHPSQSNPVNSIFNASTVNNNVGTTTLFPDTTLSSQSQQQSVIPLEPVSATVDSFERQISNVLMANTNSTTTLNQILNMDAQQISNRNTISPSNSSSSSSSSTSSSSLSSSNNMSPPVHHDVILNSEPAANISMVNLGILPLSQPSNALQVLPQQRAPPQQTQQIPTELILNTDVSPTIMCQQAQDPILNNQAAITNSILNEMDHLTTPTTQDAILNNIIMQTNPTTSSNPMITQHQHQQHQQQQQQEQQRQTTAANAMIKAAADFISSQERNMNNAVNLNTLLGMNQILNERQQQVPQLLSNITSNTLPNPQIPSNNTSVLHQTHTHPTNIQQAQQQIAQMDICPNPTQTISTQLNHFTGTNLLQNQLTTANTVPLVDILMNRHNATNSGTATTNNFVHNIQKNQPIMSNIINTTKSQESLIQAVPINNSANSLEKTKITDGHVGQITSMTVGTIPTNLVSPVTVPQAAATTIPQEITTMSDQDLLSYINPSTFDQV